MRWGEAGNRRARRRHGRGGDRVGRGLWAAADLVTPGQVSRPTGQLGHASPLALDHRVAPISLSHRHAGRLRPTRRSNSRGREPLRKSTLADRARARPASGWFVRERARDPDRESGPAPGAGSPGSETRSWGDKDETHLSSAAGRRDDERGREERGELFGRAEHCPQAGAQDPPLWSATHRWRDCLNCIPTGRYGHWRGRVSPLRG